MSLFRTKHDSRRKHIFDRLVSTGAFGNSGVAGQCPEVQVDDCVVVDNPLLNESLGAA